MDNHSFLGMGKNPDPNVSDIPVGFGMELMQNADARSNFEHLSDQQKNSLIAFIQGGLTGIEAKNRIATAVSCLANGDLSFF